MDYLQKQIEIIRKTSYWSPLIILEVGWRDYDGKSKKWKDLSGNRINGVCRVHGWFRKRVFPQYSYETRISMNSAGIKLSFADTGEQKKRNIIMKNTVNPVSEPLHKTDWGCVVRISGGFLSVPFTDIWSRLLLCKPMPEDELPDS